MWLEGRFYLEFLRLIRDPVFRGVDVPPGLRSPVLLIPGFLAGDWTLRTQHDWLQRVGYRQGRPNTTHHDAFGRLLVAADNESAYCHCVTGLHQRTGREVDQLDLRGAR